MNIEFIYTVYIWLHMNKQNSPSFDCGGYSFILLMDIVNVSYFSYFFFIFLHYSKGHPSLLSWVFSQLSTFYSNFFLNEELTYFFNVTWVSSEAIVFYSDFINIGEVWNNIFKLRNDIFRWPRSVRSVMKYLRINWPNYWLYLKLVVVMRSAP